jgi:hypothetical protein
MRAWTARADCVVLDRKVLEPLLELDRIGKVRVDWIKKDVKPWFPFVGSLNYDRTDMVGVLFLSRKPIGEWMTGTMTNAEMVALLRDNGVNAILFDGPDACPVSEEELVAASTCWATGLRAPAEVRVSLYEMLIQRMRKRA